MIEQTLVMMQASAQLGDQLGGQCAAQQPITLLRAIVIGVVQGLTEFLPISSTAHVTVVPIALCWGKPGVAFTAVIQLGSVAAILWYFWDDLSTVTLKFFRALFAQRFDSPDFRLGLGILLGTLPITLIGLYLKVFANEAFEASVIRTTAAIAITSIVMAILLAIAELVGRRKRDFSHLGLSDGILVGLAQAFALVPGASRSGSTLTAGLFAGLKRETAARFSFLLGMPAILISGIVSIPDVMQVDSAIGLLPLLGGLAAAVVSSYAAIAWLIAFLKKHSTWVFVWYRLAFGAVILIAIAAGKLQNI